MYNEADQRLSQVAAEAEWTAATDVSEVNTARWVGAATALAAFRGSPFVIESSQAFLDRQDELTPLEFRQLDKIMLLAAESPGTMLDVVSQRIEVEARMASLLNGFPYCRVAGGAAPGAQGCRVPVTSEEIEATLAASRDLDERKRLWEVSKQPGVALKSGIGELRDLRNRTATELGYSSYFHLQVADYGMSVDELMGLMDQTVADVQPLYDQVYEYTRRRLAARYGQEPPVKIPVHWLPDPDGRTWPGLVEGVDLDRHIRGQSPEWVVRQAERFYVSLGMDPLPEEYWTRSDLYRPPPGSDRRKNIDARTWSIDHDHDVRTLMRVAPNFRWFETSHRELGHVYYYLACARPQVPTILREGLNRAFYEAVGNLARVASRQEGYLRQAGVLAPGEKVDRMALLLDEALTGPVVSLPWSAGVVTHFEHDLYEDDLPPDEFNRDWWRQVHRYQGLVAPEPRGEQYCDGCTGSHIISDAAQYYDYAIAELITYQLHDYIAREILHADPRNCNYYGNREVGQWLQEILELGATRDWRAVLKEKTGEDLSSRALLEYFAPLREYLAK